MKCWNSCYQTSSQFIIKDMRYETWVLNFPRHKRSHGFSYMCVVWNRRTIFSSYSFSFGIASLMDRLLKVLSNKSWFSCCKICADIYKGMKVLKNPPWRALINAYICVFLWGPVGTAGLFDLLPPPTLSSATSSCLSQRPVLANTQKTLTQAPVLPNKDGNVSSNWNPPVRFCLQLPVWGKVTLFNLQSFRQRGLVGIFKDKQTYVWQRRIVFSLASSDWSETQPVKWGSNFDEPVMTFIPTRPSDKPLTDTPAELWIPFA